MDMGWYYIVSVKVPLGSKYKNAMVVGYVTECDPLSITYLQETIAAVTRERIR